MSGSAKLRVLLADDHALFRKGLANLVHEEPDFEVAGEAAALRPDIILMDVQMPRVNGPEATRRIRETTPEAKIVMLTVSGDEDAVFDAVQSGAEGYLLKTIDPPALFDALRGVVRGEAALASGVATTIMRAFARRGHCPAATPPRPELSRRAQEIMALVADGKSNKEIATALCLAARSRITSRPSWRPSTWTTACRSPRSPSERMAYPPPTARSPRSRWTPPPRAHRADDADARASGIVCGRGHDHPVVVCTPRENTNVHSGGRRDGVEGNQTRPTRRCDPCLLSFTDKLSLSSHNPEEERRHVS